MRSARGKSILKSNGFKEVYNGGGWSSLQAKIEIINFSYTFLPFLALIKKQA